MKESLNAGRWIGANSQEYSAIFNGSSKWLSGSKAAFIGKSISYTRIGNQLGLAGAVITVGSAIRANINKKDNTSTWVNVGITVGLYGAGFIAGTAVLPWVIGAGIIYTGARLIAGDKIDNYIDSNYGFR